MSEHENNDLDSLVGEWLPLPDVAEELGLSITAVRGMLAESSLAAIRRGSPAVLSVPAALVRPSLLPAFAGTWILLHDSGYSDHEALHWLFTPEDGESPIALLRKGHKTEVRRRAQALAF